MTQIDQPIPFRFREKILDALRIGGEPNQAEFGQILLREERDGVFVLCNVRLKQKHVSVASSGEEKRKRWTTIDTITVCAYWQSSEPYLPEFSTRPFIDMLIVKLVKLLGLKGVGHPRFDDDPEFHEKLLISAAEPETVRPVLTGRVCEVLKENCDLTTSIRGRAIVVYDDGHPVKQMIGKGPKDGETMETCKLLETKEWPRFYEAAVSIIESLRRRDSYRSVHSR
jgi:hypothetical protein